MSRYYRAKLGSVFLTSNGLQTGKPCKLVVRGLPALLLSFTGSSVQAADGTVYLQTAPVTGAKIEIEVSQLPQTVLAQIAAAVQSALDANSSVALLLTGGAPGDFNLQVLPDLPAWFDFPGEFSTGLLKNTAFRFITT